MDNRVGSQNMMRHFTPGTAVLDRLQFGDAAFMGNGPDGMPVHVGIEVKQLGDMLSSMVNGRFAGHQLPGLLRDYHLTYLILEGHWRPNPDTGVLQVFKGRQWADLELGTKAWTARELNGFLTTIETKFGVHLRRTFDRRETARLISDLHHWWNDKDYEAHRSGQAICFAGEPLLPISDLRRIAAQLPKIGWKRSGSVAEHFASATLAQGICKMMSADEAEWRKVDGIGKGIARSIVHELQKEKTS